MIVIIVIGLIMIIAMNPTPTICDSQLEEFNKLHRSTLEAAPEQNGFVLPSILKRLHDECKSGNGPGACVEYFDRLRRIAIDLERMSILCSKELGSDQKVAGPVLRAIKLMTEISWGDRGGASFGGKRAWLDASDLALFCDLKSNAKRMLGEEAFKKWRDELLVSLPDANKLNFDQVWGSSLFSIGCDSVR